MGAVVDQQPQLGKPETSNSPSPLPSPTQKVSLSDLRDKLEKVGLPQEKGGLSPTETAALSDIFKKQMAIPGDCTLTFDSRHKGPDKGAILTDERGRVFDQGTQYVSGTVSVPSVRPDGTPSHESMNFRMIYPPSNPVSNCWLNGVRYNPSEHPEIAKGLTEMAKSSHAFPTFVGKLDDNTHVMMSLATNPDPKAMSGGAPFEIPRVYSVTKDGKVSSFTNVSVPNPEHGFNGPTKFVIQDDAGKQHDLEVNFGGGKGSRRDTAKLDGKPISMLPIVP